MPYLIALVFGLGTALVLVVIHSWVSGAVCATLTVVTLYVLLERKKARLLRDPVTRKVFDRELRAWQRKLNMPRTVPIEQGRRAEAVILDLGPHDPKKPDDCPLRVRLRVSPDFYPEFEIEIEHLVPARMLSQFQPGKTWQVVYNPADLSDLDFVAYITERGNAVHTADHE